MDDSTPATQGKVTLRSKIISLLSQHAAEGLAPEEIAETLGVNVKRIRPRLTELKKAGQIGYTGGKKKFGKRSSKLVSVTL